VYHTTFLYLVFSNKHFDKRSSYLQALSHNFRQTEQELFELHIFASNNFIWCM